MADDFGDDAGQRLFDWAMRVGMDELRAGRGDQGLRASVDALVRAMENARDMSPAPDEGSFPREAGDFAKLDMHEFKDLPNFGMVQGAISAKLAEAHVWHGFREEGDVSWLVFRVSDAPKVSRCFGQLAGEARDAGTRAAEAVREQAAAHDREGARDSEPLEERAVRAREASAAQRGSAVPERSPHRHKSQSRSK